MVASVALDLGTTQFKAACFSPEGELHDLVSVPAPGLAGSELIREGNPGEYLEKATTLLADLASRVGNGTPFGIASQRSSFLVWGRNSGKAITPVVSWQDRRAANWCARHGDLDQAVRERTGLLLSPHYIAPKLASMMEDDRVLRDQVRNRTARVGTLETFLIWNWTSGQVHETDLTMAARTLLADPRGCTWSEAMLAAFGIPREVLPEIVPNRNRRIDLDMGLVVTATLADQSAAALALSGARAGEILVNLGTGVFVLVPAPGFDTRPGYLCGPLVDAGDGVKYAFEGTINAGGGTANRFGEGPTTWPASDPCPAAFAIPDEAGIGAPYWRSDISLKFSPAAADLKDADRRRIVLEGIVFRTREMVDALCRDARARRIVLAGGFTQEPFVAPAMASCLQRPVEVVEEPHATLKGVARLAAVDAPFRPPLTRSVEPDPRGAYLATKYEAWKSWITGMLEA